MVPIITLVVVNLGAIVDLCLILSKVVVAMEAMEAMEIMEATSKVILVVDIQAVCNKCRGCHEDNLLSQLLQTLLLEADRPQVKLMDNNLVEEEVVLGRDYKTKRQTTLEESKITCVDRHWKIFKEGTKVKMQSLGYTTYTLCIIVM